MEDEGSQKQYTPIKKTEEEGESSHNAQNDYNSSQQNENQDNEEIYTSYKVEEVVITADIVDDNVSDDLKNKTRDDAIKVNEICGDFVNSIFTGERPLYMKRLFLQQEEKSIGDLLQKNANNEVIEQVQSSSPGILAEESAINNNQENQMDKETKGTIPPQMNIEIDQHDGDIRNLSNAQVNIEETNDKQEAPMTSTINDNNDQANRERSISMTLKFEPKIINESSDPLSIHYNTHQIKQDCNVSFKQSEQQPKEHDDLSNDSNMIQYSQRGDQDSRTNIIQNDNPEISKEIKQNSQTKSNPELFQNCTNLISNIFEDYTLLQDKDKDQDQAKEHQQSIVNTKVLNEHVVSLRDIAFYNNYTKDIIKIQNNWKTYYDRQRLSLLKEKTFFIQRSFRKFLIQKYNLPDNFYYNDKFIKLQNDIYEDNLKENLSVLFPALFIDKSDLNSLASNMLNFSNNPIHNPYETGKINLFAKILDFDMMIESDESYETLWASIFDSIYSKCLKNCSPIQLIAVGGQHTLCVNNKGKIFTFGWNNYGQCGVPVNSTIITKEELNDDYLVEITKYNELKPKIINRVDGIKIPEIDMVIMSSSIACGEDHSLILDQEGTVWAFGLNLNGQLGLGHSRIIEKPTKITELNKHIITSVKTEGNINFAISNKGYAFMWPWSDKGEIQFSPKKLPLKMVNEKVSSIACGNNFALILNSGGIVYSMGRTNKFGQLGHGDYNPRLHPSRIEFFITNSERITQVSCGFKHCIAKSSTGRAYSWGLGVKGQLGHDSFNNYSIPIQVRFDIPFAKVYQVSAGFRSSFFLIENRKVYSCGCNGTISMEKLPVLFSVLEKVPEMALEQNYSVVRIRNTWNKSFSLFYATIADTSTMKISPVKLSSILNQIALKWEGETLEMPYIDTYAKYFPINVMKKPKTS